MSRTTRRGRPQRHYRIRVHTERRDPIDYATLAHAALEQAAMNQVDYLDADVSASTSPARQRKTDRRRPRTTPPEHPEGVPS